MADLAVVFPAREEFERACRALAAAGAAVRAFEPPAALADVAAPYVVVSDAARGALHAAVKDGLLIAGQVCHRAPAPPGPNPNGAGGAGAPGLADLGPEPAPGEDVVGRIAVAFVGPCVAEEDDLRLTAHVEGDLAPVFPYLNAELRGGTFNPQGPTFTFMDGPRLINLFPHRAAIGRLREMQDAWRTLARLKRLVNDVWARRASIQPSYERKVRVSALEVYSRLPKTNCGQCGEATCIAFAAKLLNGEQRLEHCAPVFAGEYEHLRPALEDLAAAL